MAITFDDDIVPLAPHLAGSPQELQDATRQMVTDTIGLTASDERTRYLWLHYLTLVHQQGASGGVMGTVTSLTVGSISMSGPGAVAPSGGGTAQFNTTIWGRLYLDATRRMYHATIA